jgi:hypothetical protein
MKTQRQLAGFLAADVLLVVGCSTLTKLKINVGNFFDLLYLLDGRFYCLSTLIVSVTDHYGPTGIHGIVSRISVFMLRAKKQKIKILTVHNISL